MTNDSAAEDETSHSKKCLTLIIIVLSLSYIKQKIRLRRWKKYGNKSGYPTAPTVYCGMTKT